MRLSVAVATAAAAVLCTGRPAVGNTQQPCDNGVSSVVHVVNQKGSSSAANIVAEGDEIFFRVNDFNCDTSGALGVFMKITPVSDAAKTAGPLLAEAKDSDAKYNLYAEDGKTVRISD